MRDLNYQLKQLCARNRDGSYSTQANRQRILDLVARQLNAMGFRRMSTHSLKPKHVDALVKHWMSEGMTAWHHQKPDELPALVGSQSGSSQCRSRGPTIFTVFRTDSL